MIYITNKNNRIAKPMISILKSCFVNFSKTSFNGPDDIAINKGSSYCDPTWILSFN
jgi:hypothetical protein